MRQRITQAVARRPARSELAFTGAAVYRPDLAFSLGLDLRDIMDVGLRAICSAAEAVHRRGAAVDVCTIESELEARGERGFVHEPIGELTNYCLNMDTLPEHVRRIQETARSHRRAERLAEASERARDGEDIDELLDEVRADDDKARGPIIQLASMVERRVLRFLWAPRIPIGGVTVLAGNGGDGKSTLALDIAARVTRGWAMPGDDGTQVGTPRGVVILQYEDDPGCITLDRLDASGADKERIAFITGVREREGGERLPDLDRDLRAVETAVDMVDGQLLIVDPLSAGLGPRCEMWKDEQVRRVLGPCNALAQRRALAVLGILHLGKNVERSAVHRVLGSVGLTNNARSVLLTATDPQDEVRKCVAHVKHNWSRAAKARAFRLGPFAWEDGELDIKIDDWLAAAKPSRDRGVTKVALAVDALRDYMGDGMWKERAAVLAHLGAAGHSESVVKRASRMLGVVQRKSGYQATSEWQLRELAKNGGSSG